MNGSIISDEQRSRLRKKKLILILALTFLFNLAFSIAGFRSVVGLYALLVYILLLAALSYAMSYNSGGGVSGGGGDVDKYAIQEALSDTDHPRVEIPLNIEFAPYVAAWLIWWLVTELFHDDVTVYADSIIWQFFLFPAIVLAVTWQRSAHTSTRVSLLFLLYATLTTLFFPTASWAPQHNNALLISFRVVLYFYGIFLFDYLRPPQLHHSLTATATPSLRAERNDNDGGGSGKRATRRRNQMHAAGTKPMSSSSELDLSDLESGQDPVRARVLMILCAFQSVALENERAYEIAILNAWILVSPLIVSILGLVGTTVLYTMGQNFGAGTDASGDRALTLPYRRDDVGVCTDNEYSNQTSAPSPAPPPQRSPRRRIEFQQNTNTPLPSDRERTRSLTTMKASPSPVAAPDRSRLATLENDSLYVAPSKAIYSNDLSPSLSIQRQPTIFVQQQQPAPVQQQQHTTQRPVAQAIHQPQKKTTGFVFYASNDDDDDD